VDPSSVVGPGTTVGAGAQIGAGVVLGAGVVVAPRARIAGMATLVVPAVVGAQTAIGRRATIDYDPNVGERGTFAADVSIGVRIHAGDDVLIGYGAQVGDDVTIGDGAILGNLSSLGDGVELGPGATIGRGSRIEDHARIFGDVGADVRVGTDAYVADGAQVMRGAEVGAGATVGDLVRVGRCAQIGVEAEVAAGGIVRANAAVPAGGTVGSGSVVPRGGGCVPNAAPEAGTWQITPGSPIEGADALVCETVVPPFDGDVADVAAATLLWRRNGEIWTGVTETSAWTGDRIPAGATAEGQSWTCEITVSDGDVAVPAAAVPPVVIGPADRTPDPFTFGDVTGLDPGELATSDVVTISGITGAQDVTWSGSEPLRVWIDGVDRTDTPPWRVSAGSTLGFTAIGPAEGGEVRSWDIEVGTYTTTWTIATRPPVVRVMAATEPDEHITFPAISADGSAVAFESSSGGLVPGDTNGYKDIFVFQVDTGAIHRASVSSSGTQANGASRDAAISADGRYVTFLSSATNLVSGDTNSVDDCFRHDVQTGTTIRVNVTQGGAQATGGGCSYPSISASGSRIAFAGYGPNLVPGDTNSAPDAFVRDVDAGTTTRVSVSTSGTQANGQSFAPRMSADGTKVMFSSLASNLVSGDTNSARDVFVRDLAGNTTTRVSTTSGGAQGNGESSEFMSWSADNQFVAFRSDATNLVAGDTNGKSDVFVKNLSTGAIVRASAQSGVQGNGRSHYPSLSGDGRYVAFYSDSSNLAADDTNGSSDVFVKDLVADTLTLVSRSETAVGNGDSTVMACSLSQDGSRVAIQTSATNLYPGDASPLTDVLIIDWQP
jgi:Tol biopolymer transport system component/carbonic anhydrase/acetyltransferase-like protein (isoleucine patch superfamily)